MFRTRCILTYFSTSLTQYLKPYVLQTQSIQTIPKLKLRS